MEVGEAFDLISRAIDAGRVAHGYLIAGDVRGNCAELVGRILRKLYPDAGGQIDANSHPDVAMLEPEGKLRIITVDSIRDRIVAVMDETSFSGGWKVGVICYADRIERAGDAFHARLAEGFDELAKAFPERIRTVDANGSVDEVWERIWKLVKPLT